MPTTSLLTDHGQYLRAEDGGGHEGTVVGGRPQGLATGRGPDDSAWQTFTFEWDGDVLYLKSSGDEAHGIPPSYGCAENAGQDGVFVFNRPSGGAWEALRPVKMADGRVAFEVVCRPKHYLSVQPNGDLVIRQPTWEGQPSEFPGGYESFTSSADLWAGAGGGGTVPDTGIPLAGPVRVIEEVFVDDNGAFVPIGCHFGEAFSAWTRGRQPEVIAQMRTIRQANYDHVRVWLNLGYYDRAWAGREVAFTGFSNRSGDWVPATPFYNDHRLTFNRMLADVGLRGLFSRGDCNSLSVADIEAHLREERRVLSMTPQVLFGTELANEKWQNFPQHIAEDEPKARALMEAAFGGTGWVLQNSCPPGSGESAAEFVEMTQRWFPCGNVHGTRSFHDMEFLLRRFFNYGYERYTGGYTGPKYAMESTEPGGPGQGVSGGNTSDLWKILAMHAATLIGRTATVYMSGHGVFWNGPIESQVGFWDVPRLRELMPTKDAFWGRAFHGNRAEAWVTSAGGMNNVNPNGYARIDQLLYENSGLAIAHHGGPGRKPVFRYAGTARVLDFTLQERMTFDVSPGHVQDIGGDALIVMQRG